MPNHGIIYQAHSRFKKFSYGLIRTFGAGLVSFAIIALLFSFYPIIKEEFFTKSQKISFGDLIGNSKASDFGLSSYYSIYIPKMNARANIIPNVEAGKPEIYLNALKDGVAHAAGTSFPGQGKLIYLFSHSTDSPLNFARYNAIFYLLKRLESGDRVIVYFMDKQYEYVVSEKLITSAKDTSWLIDKGIGEYLVLQTCDPIGTSLKRLIVVSTPVL